MKDADERSEANRAKLASIEKELEDLKKENLQGMEELKKRMKFLEKLLKDMGGAPQ